MFRIRNRVGIRIRDPVTSTFASVADSEPCTDPDPLPCSANSSVANPELNAVSKFATLIYKTNVADPDRTEYGTGSATVSFRRCGSGNVCESGLATLWLLKYS